MAVQRQRLARGALGFGPAARGEVIGEAGQRVRDQAVPPFVDLAGRSRLVFSPIQRFDRGQLHRLEDAGVDVRLELTDQSHEVGTTAHPADAPSGHVVRLRQRVELEPDFLSTLDLEQAQRPVASECNLRVRRVVAQNDAVAMAELDRSFEKLAIRHRGGRVVRIVEPHEPRSLCDRSRDRVEVRQPVVLGRERHDVRLAGGHERPRHVDRVTRVRGEDDVAGIDERQRHVADPVLGAERWQDLAVRVQRHGEPLAVPVCDCRAQLCEPEVRRVAMISRVRRGLLQHADDALGRRQVRIADTERDHVDAGALLLLHLAIDLSE